MTQDQLKELEQLNERWSNEHLETSADYNDLMSAVMDLLPDVLAHVKQLESGIHELEFGKYGRSQLTAERDALRFSLNTCVGAAGLGDSDELCGWIDEIKSERDAALKALDTANAKVAEMRDALVEIRDVPTVSSRVCLIAANVLERNDCARGYHHDSEWEPVVGALSGLVPFASSYISHPKRNPDDKLYEALSNARSALAHAERLTGGAQ